MQRVYLQKEVMAMNEQPNTDKRTASAEHTHGEDTPSRSYGRRALMLGAATAGAGAAVSMVARPQPASAESPDGGAKKVKLSEANVATATTSISMAVDGDTAVAGIDTSSGGGYGVSGTSTYGSGVFASSSGFNAAVYSEATGDGASGVYAYATGENGYGVYGEANGSGGTGVYGSSDGDSGGSGVYGTSPDGSGVTGTSTYGDGVYGVTYGNTTFGVSGTAYAGSTGVYGFGDGDNATGVYGEATGSGAIALFAAGDAKVTGTLSKGGGSFRIDHPLDPANKYLYHSFVESPDMMNVYNGNITLNGDGKATVELPEWFEALNRDFRYQLTSIGSFAPVYISREIAAGEFEIAGGGPSQKVSWQVTGIRQDAWANANRIPLEPEKSHEDRGRYLHPELFGGEPIEEIARARRGRLRRSA
jgi:hypothetical protein